MIAKRIFQIAIIAIMIITGAKSAYAVPILDQYFDSSGMTSLISFVGRSDKAQTFTVGTTGTLVQADVEIQRWPSPTQGGIPIPIGDLVFDIRRTTGGVPINDNTLALASIKVSADSIPTTRGWFSFDINSFDIFVTSGDILAIVLRSESNNLIDYGWFGGLDHFEDTYDLGNHYRSSSTWTLSSGKDVGFKTYVEPIPEPSTLFLLGSGLIGVFGLRKKKIFMSSK